MSRMLHALIRSVAGPVLAVLALLCAPAAAAADANDFFQSSQPVGYGLRTVATIADHTNEANEALTTGTQTYCQGDGRQVQAVGTSWFTLTGTGRPITVTAGAGFPTVLAAYRSPPFLRGQTTADVQQVLVACNFDVNRTGAASAITFDSVAGQPYWIQIGACWSLTGGAWCDTARLPATNWAIDLTPASVAPANDAAAAPAELVPGGRYDNVGAGTETEDLACNGAAYGTTVWTRYTAPTNGRLAVRVNGELNFNGVVSIYNGATRLACGVLAAEARVVKGASYAVQIGGQQGQFGPAQGTFTLGVDVLDPDGDGDGAVDAGDCQPVNPAVHPAAPDVPGNGVDDDCAGGDAAFKRVTGTPRADFDPVGTDRWRVKQIVLRGVPAGARVSVTCRGSGCKRRSQVVVRSTRKAGRVLIRGRLFRPLRRAVVRVDVRVPAMYGARYQWQFRGAKRTRYKQLCLPPPGTTATC